MTEFKGNVLEVNGLVLESKWNKVNAMFPRNHQNSRLFRVYVVISDV